MALEFRHEAEAKRYTVRDEGSLVTVLQYAEQPDAVSFYHTVTVPHRRGEGTAARLVEYAVDDVVSRGVTKIVPSCWFVAEWFDEHPERASLLG